MKKTTIAEFKRHLPDLLAAVSRGESIILQKGRKRENVAILTPYHESTQVARPLGLFSKRGKPVFKDWQLTDESFLESEPAP